MVCGYSPCSLGIPSVMQLTPSFFLSYLQDGVGIYVSSALSWHIIPGCSVSFTSFLKIHRHTKVCEYGLKKKNPYKLVSEMHSLSSGISPTSLNFSLPLLTGNVRLSPENTAFPVALSNNDWFFFQI